MYTTGETEGEAVGLGGEEDSEADGERVSWGTELSPVPASAFLHFVRCFGIWWGNGDALRSEVHSFEAGYKLFGKPDASTVARWVGYRFVDLADGIVCRV